MADLDPLPRAPDAASLAARTAAIDPDMRARLTRLFEATEIVTPMQARFADMTVPAAVTEADAATAAQPNGGRTGATPRGGPDWAAPKPWVGRTSPPDPTASAHPLADALWGVYYNEGYARVFGGTAQRPTHVTQPNTEFIGRFGASLTPQQGWNQGWTIFQADANGAVHVRKGECYIQVAPGRFTLRDGAQMTVGATVDIITDLFSSAWQPGFLYWNGGRPLSDYDSASLLRIYFNPTADAAPTLVAAIIASLDGYGIPFRIKTLADPAGYDRTDCTVLYSPRRYAALVQHLVIGAAADLLGADAATPLFTRELAPGIGLADDPADGQSFGQSRCRLMAAGVLDAWMKGLTDPEARLTAVARRFAMAGLDIAVPHLGRGRSADAEVRPAFTATSGTIRLVARPGSIPPATDPKSAADAYIEAAGVIGRQLARDAIWDGDRAGWTGWAMSFVDGGFRPAQRGMGPLLYDGTAGVAFFLAELAARGGDAIIADAARGAIRSVAASAENFEGRGLYTGTTGMGLAMIHGGERLDMPELVEDGISLIGRVTDADFEPLDFDYLGGRAGVIVALIDVARRYDRPDLAETALAIARTLAADGVRDVHGLSWQSAIPSANNLLGLGHGAAGPAAALIEAAGIDGDTSLRAAGEAALAYERAWFDPAQQAWPDFRIDTTQGQTRENHVPVYAPTWCNGSVGIAASRLRLLELLPDDPQLLQEVNAGLQHMSAYLTGPIPSNARDFCLCHGTVGAAETVLLAGEILKRDDVALVAHQVGRWVIDSYINPDIPLPCGVQQTGEAPGLMMGLSGIGHFLLRLADPAATPSALILRPPRSKPATEQKPKATRKAQTRKKE
ncbi:Lanthionine synthetase C-like protein [Roseivivax lentus]|uniref:Lanthionine synthetase C-like protein n=1 Tax=Roseivivax lentus TaxID=633194 RepID=A0A1N7NXX1_9RHOB|nr:lanthionine synthetase LanC family protein [Roseivivax lentus]SIT03197.1 Lanthionine synthetase C-like protein [Roseivivax lentus]